jgi:hypothetical protein
MANYKGHLAGGVVVYACLLYVVKNSLILSVSKALEWLLCSLLGSLFPDIDTKSKGQLLFYQCLLLIMMLFLWQKKYMLMAYMSIISLVPLVVKHRGIFHSVWLWLGIIGSILFYAYGTFPAYGTALFFDSIFFMGGIISHLILDRGPIKWLRVS